MTILDIPLKILCYNVYHNSEYNKFYNIIGLGENGLVLDSAEFLDLKTKKWTKTSSLKVGRTEHVMSLVYGIPTVIGGIELAWPYIFTKEYIQSFYNIYI